MRALLLVSTVIVGLSLAACGGATRGAASPEASATASDPAWNPCDGVEMSFATRPGTERAAARELTPQTIHPNQHETRKLTVAKLSR